MIRIRTTYSSDWYKLTVDPRVDDGMSLGASFFLLSGKNLSHRQEAPTDAGFLTYPQTEAAMANEGYHDCFHYDVDATFERQVVPFKSERYTNAQGKPRFRCTLPTGSVLEDVIAWCPYGGETESAESVFEYQSTYWRSAGDFGVVYHRQTIHKVKHDSEAGTISAFIEHWSQKVPYDWIKPAPKPYDPVIVQKWVSWSKLTGQYLWYHTDKAPDPVRNFPAWYFSIEPSRDDFKYQAILHKAEEDYCFGDLSYEAAASVRPLDINGIMYLKDAGELGKLAKGLLALSKPLSGAASIAKACAGTYLAAHYGLRLTVRDTQEIADRVIAAKEPKYWPTQRIGAQHHKVVQLPGDDTLYSVEWRLSGEIDTCSAEASGFDDRARSFCRKLYELDLMPSLENIWDMIPFSFVVDWVLPIGDAAEWFENKHYLSTFKVHKAFYTRKVTWAQHHSFTLGDEHFEGSASYRIYDRYCTAVLHLPPLRVDQPSLKGLHRHFVEGTALVIANIL